MAKTIHHKSGVSTHLQATLASEKDQKSSQIVPHVPLYLTSTRPMCSPYVPLTNRIPSISVPFLNRLGNWPAEERKLIQVIMMPTTFCPNAFRDFKLHWRIQGGKMWSPLQLTLSLCPKLRGLRYISGRRGMPNQAQRRAQVAAFSEPSPAARSHASQTLPAQRRSLSVCGILKAIGAAGRKESDLRDYAVRWRGRLTKG